MREEGGYVFPTSVPLPQRKAVQDASHTSIEYKDYSFMRAISAPHQNKKEGNGEGRDGGRGMGMCAGCRHILAAGGQWPSRCPMGTSAHADAPRGPPPYPGCATDVKEQMKKTE